MPTDIAMALLGPLAQLAHVSQHQNGAPGKAGEYIHRSTHGYRVGVVTVIDHPHAIWRQLRDSTALDRLQILQAFDHGTQRYAQRMSGSAGRQGIGDVVLTRAG